jgi:hypothetical protein
MQGSQMDACGEGQLGDHNILHVESVLCVLRQENDLLCMQNAAWHDSSIFEEGVKQQGLY